MKEIFVIYNKNTGFIDGGSGKIDRDWDTANADGSTMSEHITNLLVANTDLAVVYLEMQLLPDRMAYKIVAGELTELDVNEISELSLPNEQDALIRERVRNIAIDELKAEGKLPVDFVDSQSFNTK